MRTIACLPHSVNPLTIARDPTSLRRDVKPLETEPICLVSFEIACILLGGGPTKRPSFWKAYRNELELNRKTDYQNYHVHLCRDQLVSLSLDRSAPVYYRNDRLTCEKEVYATLLSRLQ